MMTVISTKVLCLYNTLCIIPNAPIDKYYPKYVSPILKLDYIPVTEVWRAEKFNKTKLSKLYLKFGVRIKYGGAETLKELENLVRKDIKREITL